MEENLAPPKDEIVFLILNPEMESFKRIFTKLEATTAFEFISEVTNEFGIPSLTASRKRDNNSGIDSKETGQFPSKYDEEFQKRYSEALERMKGKKYTYSGFDPFVSDEIVSALKNMKRKKIMICGNPIESDCIAAVFGALRTGFQPTIVSDACSSSSERVYFEALDVVSRVIPIVDTRDFMKTWRMV